MKGYTLIEILVGLTIIGIVFGVGYAGFRDFSRREQLSSVSKVLVGDLRLAQARALSGQKPEDIKCTAQDQRLDGYSLQITSEATYEINAKCSAGVVNDPAIKSVILPIGVTISTPVVNPLTFKTLGEGTNIPSGQSVILTLTQTATGKTYTVTISAGGEIK